MDKSRSNQITIKQIEYSSSKIKMYLDSNKNLFLPSLEKKVDIERFSKKIFDHATQFWVFYHNTIVGFAAVYLNDNIDKNAYVTSISLLDEFQGIGLGKRLFNVIYESCRDKRMKTISLEVNKKNLNAKVFYTKLGFETQELRVQSLIMKKKLKDRNFKIKTLDDPK